MSKEAKDKPKPTYWARIPAEVRYDKTLPPAARLLYAEITALSNKEGYCWASNSYFAKLFEVKAETISRWITKLQQRDHISTKIVTAEGNKRYIYLLTKKAIALLTEKSIAVDENVETPIDEKVNPSTNNSSINREGGIEDSSLPDDLDEQEKIELSLCERITQKIVDKGWTAEGRSSNHEYRAHKALINAITAPTTITNKYFEFFFTEILGLWNKFTPELAIHKLWYTQIYNARSTEVIVEALQQHKMESKKTVWGPDIGEIKRKCKVIQDGITGRKRRAELAAEQELKEAAGPAKTLVEMFLEYPNDELLEKYRTNGFMRTQFEKHPAIMEKIKGLQKEAV